jgi:hypothetical protein
MTPFHCVTITLISTDDEYEKSGVFRSAEDAQVAVRGAELMGLGVACRKVEPKEVLFNIAYSDGDRTEKAALSLGDLRTEAENMRCPELAAWVDGIEKTVEAGLVPDDYNKDAAGYHYVTVHAWRPNDVVI